MSQICHLPFAVEHALRRISRGARLTPTLETRLFDIAQGLKNKEIAERHVISTNTVKTQIRCLLHHLGLTCRHEIQDAVLAASLREESGTTADETYEFLLLRFE